MNLSPQFFRSIRVLVATLAVLVLLDLTVGLFLYRTPERLAEQSALAKYFNYGRSIGGKLSISLGTGPSNDERVIRAGWLDQDPGASESADIRDGSSGLIGVYGQSFAFNAALKMKESHPELKLRMIGAPAAPVSHSFAALSRDLTRRSARVSVIGVLASSVAKTGQMSLLASTFESPAPFTFPKFSLGADGQLQSEEPLITTASAFIGAFHEQSKLWQSHLAQLRRHSPGLDNFIVESNFLDRSVLIRLLRRGWVNSQNQDAEGSRNSKGESELFLREIPVVRALLIEAVKVTRAKDEALVVVLLNDRGYHLALDEHLHKDLEQAGATVISTSDIFSSKDPRNFVSDGHYSEEANEKLASALFTAIAKLVR